MTTPHADDLIAAHEIDYTGHDTEETDYICSCGWGGTSDEADQHAREHGLCGECHGSGEGPGQRYGGDDSGIGPCHGCGGGRTAEAEEATARAMQELDAVQAESEQAAQSGLFEREPPEA